MSINDSIEKVKSSVQPYFVLIIGLLIASIFFALGRLSAIEERHTPIKIIEPQTGQTAAVISSVTQGFVSTSTPAEDAQPSGEVIGSKTGMKYYYPWCGTIKRVKPENQVHFDSIALAKAAGYTPGGNCKGLQ